MRNQSLNDQNPKSLAKLLKLLANENRLKILILFWDGQPRSVNTVAEEVGIAQSTASEQLQKLRVEGNLLIAEKNEKEMMYRPNRKMILEVIDKFSKYMKSCC